MAQVQVPGPVFEGGEIVPGYLIAPGCAQPLPQRLVALTGARPGVFILKGLQLPTQQVEFRCVGPGQPLCACLSRERRRGSIGDRGGGGHYAEHGVQHGPRGQVIAAKIEMNVVVKIFISGQPVRTVFAQGGFHVRQPRIGQARGQVPDNAVDAEPVEIGLLRADHAHEPLIAGQGAQDHARPAFSGGFADIFKVVGIVAQGAVMVRHAGHHAHERIRIGQVQGGHGRIGTQQLRHAQAVEGDEALDDGGPPQGAHAPQRGRGPEGPDGFIIPHVNETDVRF
ncbi:MAG: hypothetical protein BWX80_00955 [Candidatus Hydrogenedentes bacterium ADurb.Bin101]|nr:MAG: hypothetical protein BWX80_00955 [Candidatus Hydrogenedentes bacterium ADurb.Bin101]